MFLTSNMRDFKKKKLPADPNFKSSLVNGQQPEILLKGIARQYSNLSRSKTQNVIGSNTGRHVSVSIYRMTKIWLV
jgi:hypothetical protein